MKEARRWVGVMGTQAERSLEAKIDALIELLGLEVTYWADPDEPGHYDYDLVLKEKRPGHRPNGTCYKPCCAPQAATTSTVTKDDET